MLETISMQMEFTVLSIHLIKRHVSAAAAYKALKVRLIVNQYETLSYFTLETGKEPLS